MRLWNGSLIREKKGLISSNWLWGYYMLCIDPSEQTAAVRLNNQTQPFTPHFMDLLLLRKKPTCINVKYVLD